MLNRLLFAAFLSFFFCFSTLAAQIPVRSLLDSVFVKFNLNCDWRADFIPLADLSFDKRLQKKTLEGSKGMAIWMNEDRPFEDSFSGFLSQIRESSFSYFNVKCPSENLFLSSYLGDEKLIKQKENGDYSTVLRKNGYSVAEFLFHEGEKAFLFSLYYRFFDDYKLFYYEYDEEGRIVNRNVYSMKRISSKDKKKYEAAEWQIRKGKKGREWRDGFLLDFEKYLNSHF